MAQYELIDTYLGSLRQRMQWRRDVDDLVDEARDHLLVAVERTRPKAPTPIAAQRLALERFGDPDALAEAFASTTTGGIAVPTQFTKLAGYAGIVAAILWPVALALGWFEENDLGWFPWIGATIATGVLTAGIYARHGGALGRVGLVGMIIFYVGLAIAIPLFWAVPVYMGLMGAGMLLVGAAALRAGVLPSPPTLLFATAFLMGAIVFSVGRTLEIGDPDRWGDYIGVIQVSIVTGIGLYSIAAVWLGRWLAAEEPADITPSSALTA